MSGKKSAPDGSQRGTFLAAIIIVALVIDAVIVAILIVAKGFVSALPATVSGIVFVVLSVLYWLRSEKDNANADTLPPPTTPKQRTAK